MNWSNLLTTCRLGQEHFVSTHIDARNEYQRDYDRLIFSAPFRRLQNKTQVFPLPGNIFVHNRLTHSLEVSSVGRSLAARLVPTLRERHPEVCFDGIDTIVGTACLSHDLGNPPFGHSGERAISTFFSEGKGKDLKERCNFTDAQWSDFLKFEGNANAFRLLTHQYLGRREGGFVLTYSTLASIVKYPYESQYCPEKKQKFGFMQDDKANYERIAQKLGICRQPDDERKYARHPLVYLVEAADDICYEVMDMEDAFKLHILSEHEIKQHFLAFFPEERQKHMQEVMQKVEDPNEHIAYLRSCVIGTLSDACAAAFLTHEEEMLSGCKLPSLLDMCDERISAAYKACTRLSVKKIYRSPLVLDIELGGYKIILTLLEQLIEAVFNPSNAYSEQLINRIPSQYDVLNPDYYLRVLAVLDYIAGMTDVYALDLYRKITGMSMPSL